MKSDIATMSQLNETESTKFQESREAVFHKSYWKNKKTNEKIVKKLEYFKESAPNRIFLLGLSLIKTSKFLSFRCRNLVWRGS